MAIIRIVGNEKKKLTRVEKRNAWVYGRLLSLKKPNGVIYGWKNIFTGEIVRGYWRGLIKKYLGI